MMAPETGWLPDFLTPRPTGPFTEFGTELAVVAATPWRKVRADLEIAYADEPLPAALRGRPTAIRDRVVAALADYHRHCIEPFWPRIRSVLEADIAYRARRLAEAGARGLFDELDWRVRWDDGHILIDRLRDLDYRIEIDGRGLPLVPSLFVRGAVTYISATEPPVVVYPARGRGAVWDTAPPLVDDAVAELIGAAAGPAAHPAARAGDDDRSRPPARGHVQRGEPAPAGVARGAAGEPDARRPVGAVPAQRTGRRARRRLTEFAGGLGLEPRLHGSKGRRAADYPIPHRPAQRTGGRGL